MKEEPKHSRLLICELCDGRPEFDDSGSFLEHCRDKHEDLFGADGNIKGTRRLKTAVDGTNFYSNTSTWSDSSGRIFATDIQSGPRGKRRYG